MKTRLLLIILLLLLPLASYANNTAGTPRPPFKNRGTPEEFLRDLYSRYDRSDIDKAPNLDGSDAAALADPTLLKLIIEEKKLSNGVDAFDEDPICECQDWDKLEVKNINFTKPHGNRLDVIATFTLGEGWTENIIRYELVKIKSTWKIHNLIFVKPYPYDGFSSNMIDRIKDYIIEMKRIKQKDQGR